MMMDSIWNKKMKRRKKCWNTTTITAPLTIHPAITTMLLPFRNKQQLQNSNNRNHKYHHYLHRLYNRLRPPISCDLPVWFRCRHHWPLPHPTRRPVRLIRTVIRTSTILIATIPYPMLDQAFQETKIAAREIVIPFHSLPGHPLPPRPIWSMPIARTKSRMEKHTREVP